MVWFFIKEVTMIICEHCGKNNLETHEAHSMLIVLQKVNKIEGYSFYQCDKGNNIVNGRTMQHWHCNKDEMKVNVIKCINEHFKKEYLKCMPVNEIPLHNIILCQGLKCKVCFNDLSFEAYRFCLTNATPINNIPDESFNILKEWTCSFEHAKQSVIKTIKEME